MHITTYSKVHFTPLEPKEEEILLEDIVHAQSLMTRANGHFPEFYSVAQHSIACGKEAAARGYSGRVILACLLHDASEAYLSDITRPVKAELDGYHKMEETLQNAIYRKFLGNLPTEEERKAVKMWMIPAYIMSSSTIWVRRLKKSRPKSRVTWYLKFSHLHRWKRNYGV